MLRKGARRDWLPAPQTRVRRDTPLLTGFPRSGRAVARGAGPNPRLAPEVAGGTVVSSSGPALPDHEQARQDPAGEQRKPASARTVIWHSALEFLLTFVLLFGVVTFVRWVIGPSAVSRAVPQIHLQLVIVGSAVALLVAGLILSPAGRVSGGHMNPRDLAGDVALRGFPRRRRAALHGVAARRLSARSAGSGRGLGQLSRPAPGVLRRAPAGSQLVSVAAVRHRGARGRRPGGLTGRRPAGCYRSVVLRVITRAGAVRAWSAGSVAGSMDRCGRVRSSQPGSHQLARPDRCMTAGTRRVRRKKASSKTAAARPIPISPMDCWMPTRRRPLEHPVHVGLGEQPNSATG